VLISELAQRTGVSPRSLRHYEEQGLLHPSRTANGYRRYSASDVARVAQIKTMLSAGLNTSLIRRYLDCARTGDQGVHLEMCPSLRAELDAVARRLDAQQASLRETRRRLDELISSE